MRKLMLGIIVLILLVPVVYSLTISTVYSNAVGDRTVEINWTTDTEADSKVVYGKTTSLGEVEYSSARVQWHGVVLTGLEPDTEYYYGVESSDGLEVKYDSNDNNFYKFRTKEQILFANILPDNIGTDSAEIKWETNIDAGSLVRYGLSSSNLDKQASVDGKTKTHNVKLTGLQNGTTYFYNIISDYAEAGVRDFTTRVDVEPPVVYDFSVPEYYNKDIIDIKGTTKPSSEIFVYLEGRLIRQGTARSTGEFSFNYISLAKDVNKIKLRVVDPYGEVFEKEYTTTIDIVPPEVTLSKIPDALQTTTQTLTGTVNEPVSVTITINDKIVSFNTTEKISQTLAFVEGDNNLIVTVKDRAGNVYELKKKVYADSKNPTLTLTNPISSYDPSIGKNIRFKGTLSEPGDIFIKVNERTYKTSTTDNLSWEQVIELERKVETTGTISTTTEARAELSPEYQNTIEIYAVDRSGRESTKSSGTIRYKLCGTAGDWDVVIGKPNPGALSPFDLKRGYGLVGFQIDLVWRGTGQGTVTGKPTLSAFTQVGSALRESYNLDMIGTVSSDFLKTKGYATIQMRKTDKFQELESLKFPLQIDIPYSYDEFGTAKAGRQQTCITVDVLVDKTFDESKIPENFVKSSINFLNKTIDVLDKMIDPLKKVEKFVFFGCKAMQIRNIFVKANEVKACYAFNNNIPQKTVGSKAEAIKDSQDCANVDKARMKAGAAGDPVSMCQSCMEAKISSEKAKHEMSLVCDRYTCPSVPTVQYYARVNAENEKKKLTKLYYSPGIGFSLKSNCDLVMLNNLIKDMKDGTINNKKDYEACEKEYEYLWGPGSLTQMTRIFESSAKLSAPKQSTFQTAGGGFFNSIASLCGKIKKRTEARKLWIDGREFSYNNGSWSVTDVIKVGASETEVKNIQSKAREITQLGDNFYYKYEADTNKLFTETATNFKGENLALSYVKNVQGEVAVDSKGVLYIKKKSTDGKKVWWQPDDTPRSLVSSTTGRPLILNQLRQEFERQENEGKYLIESTDGLMSSLQAVCVPGIISHLQNIKTISEQLRRCFQNLLINDEFTAGYCKSLISEHICDLVFNLIRCSFKMFESQPRTARPQAGVPGFFQALSAAGSSVNRDIKERYGNTVTFDAIFNERKLVHQMCLGAFNHDWDLNIETILEENRQKAVPIKPDIFLYPTEMRFYGFNPVTGRTNIMYHLGLGIVAGADMTYEVNLVCSNDNSCSSAMGFAGGRCDCSYENRGITKKNIARGTLTKGESNWDDPDKSDIRHLLKDSLYRYDKIEVKWQYRDAKNQLVTDTIVKDIALVGQMPDEGCKLDIISGEFRCLFGFGAQGYAKFVGDVQPLQSTFQVGDSIKFKGRIDKYSPDGETNRNVILRAEVRDSKGVRIDDTGGLLEFNLREDKRYYLESDFAEKGVPGYVIKQDDFKSESGLVTGVMRSTVSSSKFYKIYPTPYTALVSGDIGANNVIIKLLDSTYQVSTTSPVRGGTTGALTDPGKELKLYVGNGVITLPDVRNNRVVNEQLTFEPPKQTLTFEYKVKLTLHTTDDAGVANAEPIDQVEVAVKVRNSQSSSTCRSDGYIRLEVPCDCNGDGAKECGTGDNRYCYAKTGTTQAQCYKYPVCRQGLVTGVCDCGGDGDIDYKVGVEATPATFVADLFTYDVGKKEYKYYRYDLYRDTTKNLLYYTSEEGKTYLDVKWGDSIKFDKEKLNVNSYDGATIVQINGKYYAIKSNVAQQLIVTDAEAALIKASGLEESEPPSAGLFPDEEFGNEISRTLKDVFEQWNNIPTGKGEAWCEGGSMKYCFSGTCYENDINTKQTSTIPTDFGQKIVYYAKNYLLTPYKWGGSTEATGFDCSGLVYQVYKDAQSKRLIVRKTANDYWKDFGAEGKGKDTALWKTGDLCFWDFDQTTGPRGKGVIDHIGIYKGLEAGAHMIIDASSSKDAVVDRSIDKLGGISDARFKGCFTVGS